MHSCDSPGLLPLEQAINKLLSAVQRSQKTETRALDQALDAILAETVHSSINVPGYDNSAMDGYALRAEDGQKFDQLSIAGKSFAGSPFQGEVEPGQCVRIMTGAAIPAECDCVVMQENCLLSGDNIELQQAANAGDNVRLAGNDIHQGQAILSQGRRLSPTDIGLLASIGQATVVVYQPLVVGLFSTGDELRLPQQKLDPACIYDSNRYVVAAMLERLNMRVVNLGIIADEPEALRQAFLSCQQQCDAIVSSGGVSVGEADYTKTVLEELGDIEFWQLAIKPGKPFAFGKLGDTPFFGLPGNPSSAAITFHQLAVPALLKMAGEHQRQTPRLTVSSHKNIKKRPGRTDFQRGFYEQDENGQINLDSSLDQSSGMLSSMSRANCYIKLEQQRGNVSVGEEIEIIPFDRWIE